MTQVVDQRAALIAALIASSVFFAMNVFVLPMQWGGNGWIVIRLFASIVLGTDVLAPPATFDGAALAVALLTNFAIAIPAVILLAVIIHRYGMAVGILGGAVFGAALYAINMYSLTYFFPQFFTLQGVGFFLSHVVFGALGGGLYEAFEVERFVPIDSDKGVI
ncbi:MAG: hypothetical protein R3A47_06130 [Polyangiales bacterium]